MDLRVILLTGLGATDRWVYHGQLMETSRQWSRIMQLQQIIKWNEHVTVCLNCSFMEMNRYMDNVWIFNGYDLCWTWYVLCELHGMYMYMSLLPHWVCGSPLAIFFQVINSLFDRSLVTLLHTEVRLKPRAPRPLHVSFVLHNVVEGLSKTRCNVILNFLIILDNCKS